MQKFSLDIWLQDKSRKICTRDGRSVRILCIDCGVRESQPILTEITCGGNTKVLEYYNIDGTTQDKNLNLFFTDEEEELTDFESDLFTAFSDAWQQYLRGESVDVEKWDKEHSKDLLESARKELEKSNVIVDKDKYIKNCDYYYEHGKKDALKSLPKWKKATEDKEFDRHVLLLDDEDRVVLTTEIYEGEYYIEVNELKGLPKE